MEFGAAKKICQKYQISPLRRRGQNFLANQWILERMIESAELKNSDIILEIGAGFGILTKELAKKVKKVLAVEIDKKLIEILRENLGNCKNVEIICDNILEFQAASYKLQDYKIVANLPYNITGAILRKFLTEKPKPNLMVLMIQKEVAERICAKPGKMSLLSVMVQFYGQPKIIQIVSKNNFWPRPKVDSAILSISQIGVDKKYRLTQINEKKFFQLVRQGFSSPRKCLINNLAKIMEKEKIKEIFQKINLNTKIRAQELSIENWIKIYEKQFSQN